jgi:hypothetical protein
MNRLYGDGRNSVNSNAEVRSQNAEVKTLGIEQTAEINRS